MSLTPQYGWDLPDVGADEDAWGDLLRTLWTDLDTLLGGTNATEFAILDGATVSTAELNLLDGVTATTAEINYIDGVTSAIQTQLDAKEATDAEILRANADDNVTGGYTATSDDDGTKSSGTYTPDPAGGNFKHIINGGAFTLAAPTATGCYTLMVEIVNNASAGAITFSGFDKESGDTLTTTNGDDFQLVITKSNTKVSVVRLDVT
ncbi:hypothetical protein [Lentibacter algarum]|uniref:hypothetical protein n=1 Tax=Lentibacter algarum TaxID=576131 RepID=UPI0026F34017|nr:hypothetical protein [Lentibacter algarum]